MSRSSSRLTHRKAYAGVLVAGLLSALVKGQKEKLIDYRAGQEEERIFHFKMFWNNSYLLCRTALCAVSSVITSRPLFIVLP